MLKKKLCKKCWNKQLVRWRIENEIGWKEGDVYCPGTYIDPGKWLRKTTDKPPSKCPFYLEHII